MTSQRVHKQWLNFEANVIPSNAPAVQRQEMRRAFYAGAALLLKHLQDTMDDDVSEADGVDILEGIEQECREFFAQELSSFLRSQSQ